MNDTMTTNHIRELMNAIDETDARLTGADKLIQGVNALLARPIPDVTRNVGYTVRTVMAGRPGGNGLLPAWYVACEDPERGAWVTWQAYTMDGERAGRLAYHAGHYFESPDPAQNKRDAEADLAVREGLMPAVALRIADEIVRYHPEHGPWNLIQKQERRVSGWLRTRYGR